jgi:hypothetical protein
MLIHEVIKVGVENHLLRHASPTVPWAGTPRVFLMCRPLWESIEDGRASLDFKSINRWATLEADIGAFIEGGYVDENFIKQLEEYKFEHWELRSLRPKPSLRVFGRFAHPDIFIGTHAVERKYLGAKHDLNWEIERLVCEDHWQAAGLPNPFSDAPNFDYGAYITENASRNLKVPK